MISSTKYLLSCLLAFVIASGLLVAEEPYHGYRRHQIRFGAGAGLPGEDLQPYFRGRPAISVGYGYRFHRNFQFDIGLDVVFRAADVRKFLFTDIGIFRIRDYQFLVPFGGRVILPAFEDRLLVYGGGGGAYLNYSEILRQPSEFFRIDCPICGGRDGWGYYALLGFSAAVDNGQHVRLGFTSRMIRGSTRGYGFGEVPNVETQDSWLSLVGEITFAF